MITPRPLIRSTAKRGKPATIDLDELDRRLDVPSEGWDKQVRKVVRELRTHGTTVEIPTAVAFDSTAESAVTWGRLYEQQIRRLPKMDRAEEFAMARRYEFFRARLHDALERVGVRGDDVGKHVAHPSLPLPKKARPAALEYLHRARSEYEALRNLYVERSLHLVFAKVNRYRGLGVDEIDLIQEGNASLFQAIEGFDWRRDVRFNTYAQYWIHQAILKNLYDASRTVRLPVWIQKAHRKIQRVREAELQTRGMMPPVELVAEQLDMPAQRVDEILGVRRGAVSLDGPAFGDEQTSIGQLVADEHILPIEERVRDGDLGASLGEALAKLPAREKLILERRFGLTEQEPETLAEIAVDLGVTAERVRQLQNAALARLRRPEVRRALKAFAN